MIEELYNKIDKFCNETDWSKYLTYEHALEEFIKEFVEEETKELEKENAELKEKLNRYKHDCPNCSAFGKHCPHRVNGDPYTYDCYLTVTELEKENAELKDQLTKAKELLKKIYNFEYGITLKEGLTQMQKHEGQPFSYNLASSYYFFSEYNNNRFL